MFDSCTDQYELVVALRMASGNIAPKILRCNR